MKRTHLSLYYLIGYLIPSGLGLLLVPQLPLKLLFSNGDYGDVMPRLAGLLALVVGILVVQIVRLHIETLYTTLLGVRAVMMFVLLAIFFYSQDPFFIALLGFVGFGVLLTAVSYWLDRRSSITAQRQTS